MPIRPFFPVRPCPTYANGVIKLNRLKRPTVLGYMYGGIYSTVQQTANTVTQTGASNEVFQVTLTPNRDVRDAARSGTQSRKGLTSCQMTCSALSDDAIS